jgi:glycosyltransferase involved in cell wall biosynthesis
MKIAHICLSGAFSEGMNYQDNALVDVNVADGHSVLVVSDCRTFSGGVIVPTPPERSTLGNGALLVRLPFYSFGFRGLTERVKLCPKLYDLLVEFSPDVILYHGALGWAMRTVAKYKRINGNVTFYIDSHEDEHNSGLSFVSRLIQYRIFNRYIIRSIIDDVDKIFYISTETKEFLVKFLNLPESILEFYPLGGTIVDEAARAQFRLQVRASLGVEGDKVVFLHSGKLDYRKKTVDILNALAEAPDLDCVLLIVGLIPDEISSILEPLIAADRRVRFLGWKDPSELIEIMCASDVYIQPGGQSVSLQNAICCGLPVLVYPHRSHFPYIDDSGYFVSNSSEIQHYLRLCIGDPDSLLRMSAGAYQVARSLLDYRKLGRRLYWEALQGL